MNFTNLGNTNPNFSFAANDASCVGSCLKTVYACFETAKAPESVIKQLSSANVLCAITPGALESKTKIVEMLVPKNTSTDAILSKLKRGFEDVTEVTADFCCFGIAVPATEYKRAAEGLAGLVYRTNRVGRIAGGEAFFTITANPTTTPDEIAECLTNAKIRATHIEQLGSFPQPANTNNANPGTNQGFNAAAQPAGNFNNPFFVSPQTPWLTNPMAPAFWNNPLPFASPFAMNTLPNANPHPTNTFFTSNNYTNALCNTLTNELQNPTSPITRSLAQMGVDPTNIVRAMHTAMTWAATNPGNAPSNPSPTHASIPASSWATVVPA